MTKVVQELVELENLKNAAIFHKVNCSSENCGVTLYYLRETGKRLVKFVTIMYDGDTQIKAAAILEQFPLV